MNKKLRDFNYYKNKLPLILKNSYGFVEQYKIFDQFTNGASPVEKEDLTGLNTESNLGKVYKYIGESTEDFSKNSYYKVIVKYLVKYNLNGGEGTVPEDAYYEKGEEVNISTDYEFISDNGAFIGWSEDSQSTNPEYVSSTTININKDIILYAIYKKPESFSTDMLKVVKYEAKRISKYYDENGELPSDIAYQLGDVREVKSRNTQETYHLRIVDFCKDSVSYPVVYGSNKAGITLISDDVTTRTYSNPNTYDGDDNLFNLDFTNYIVSVSKKYNGGQRTSNFITWSPSLTELLGVGSPNGDSSVLDGEQYTYYKEAPINAEDSHIQILNTGSTGSFRFQTSSTSTQFTDMFGNNLTTLKHYWINSRIIKHKVSDSSQLGQYFVRFSYPSNGYYFRVNNNNVYFNSANTDTECEKAIGVCL